MTGLVQKEYQRPQTQEEMEEWELWEQSGISKAEACCSMRSLQSQACVQLPRFCRISHHWLWGGIRQIGSIWSSTRGSQSSACGLHQFCTICTSSPVRPLRPWLDTPNHSDSRGPIGSRQAALTSQLITWHRQAAARSPQHPAPPGRWFWWRPPLSHDVWKRIAGAAWNPQRNAGSHAAVPQVTSTIQMRGIWSTNLEMSGVFGARWKVHFSVLDPLWPFDPFWSLCSSPLRFRLNVSRNFLVALDLRFELGFLARA